MSSISKKTIWMIVVYMTIILWTAQGICESIKITLTFAGDCVLGANAPIYNSRGAYNDYITRFGYDYPFKQMKDLFLTDDLTMINLEGVLKDNGRNAREGLPYHFRGPTSYTKIMTQSGIEAVNLGNNHTLDYGPEGLASTKNALASANIGYCIDKDIYRVTIQNIEIAVLGFSRTGFLSNRDWVIKTMPSLKREGVKLIIVHLHSGQEYNYSHALSTELIAHTLIDAGADIVIGHHPHVLQGVEVYKNRMILYSLGNFSFGGVRGIKPKAIQTMVARFEIVFDHDRYVSQQLTILPARSTGYSDKERYQPRLVGGNEAADIISLIQKDTPFKLNPYVEFIGAVQDPVIRDPFEDRKGNEWLVKEEP